MGIIPKEPTCIDITVIARLRCFCFNKPAIANPLVTKPKTKLISSNPAVTPYRKAMFAELSIALIKNNVAKPRCQREQSQLQGWLLCHRYSPATRVMSHLISHVFENPSTSHRLSLDGVTGLYLSSSGGLCNACHIYML